MNSADCARRIAQELETVSLEKSDPVVEALDLVIDCALNDEMDQVVSGLNSLLIEKTCPEISRLLVKNNSFASPDRAVTEAVAEVKRIRRQYRQNQLLEQLRGESDSEKRLKLLMEISQLNTLGDAL